ncbi:MAG: ABC transporter permease, partial [Anaerolineales bacterium]
MSPLALIFLIIGIPALLGLLYIFMRGSAGLRRYILTRIALTLPMVFILATLVFFVMRVLPGDPVSSALGPKGTPELVAQIREQLGLNEPLIVQYGRFLRDIVTFDFGDSLTGGHRPIIDEMSERFPATLELVTPAATLALAIGIA